MVKGEFCAVEILIDSVNKQQDVLPADRLRPLGVW